MWLDEDNLDRMLINYNIPTDPLKMPYDHIEFLLERWGYIES